MPSDLAAAIDAVIAFNPEPRPSRSFVIRYGLRAWLTEAGVLKAADAEKSGESGA